MGKLVRQRGQRDAGREREQRDETDRARRPARNDHSDEQRHHRDEPDREHGFGENGDAREQTRGEAKRAVPTGASSRGTSTTSDASHHASAGTSP